MSLQIENNIIGICVRLKFENVNYSSEINHADAQTSNTSTGLWFYSRVLLHYYKNSPPISKSWIRAWSREYYTHPVPVVPHQGKIPGAAPAFSALVSPAEKRALAISSWETISVTLEFFESIISQLLHFCGAKTRGVCVGISGAIASRTKFFRGTNKLCRSHGFSWR